MTKRFRYAVFSISAGALLNFATIARADDLAYVTTPTQAFGVVDLNTGVFTQRGVSGAYLEGLGELNDTLYGVTNAFHCVGCTNTLYAINTANGAITSIASTSVGINLFGSTTNGLFGLAQDDQDLYSINPVTGTATLIGPIGVAKGTTGGLSVGASSLYYENSFPGSSSLYSLNTTTGGATLLGSVSPGACLKSMTFESGTLYDGSGYCVASSDIFTVNPANGAAILVANVTGFSDVNGLAPVAPAIPEPATAAITCLGLVSVGLRLCAKKRSGRSALPAIVG